LAEVYVVWNWYTGNLATATGEGKEVKDVKRGT
jgi:hypothetical protein